MEADTWELVELQERISCSTEWKGLSLPTASSVSSLVAPRSLSLCDVSFFLTYSVQFSHSVVSDSLQPHGLQCARPPCPSPTPRACSNSSPSSRWCHPTISSFVIPLSSCLQSFPASGSFAVSQFFTSGAQSISLLLLLSCFSHVRLCATPETVAH